MTQRIPAHPYFVGPSELFLAQGATFVCQLKQSVCATWDLVFADAQKK